MILKGFLLMVAFVLSSKTLFLIVHKQVCFFSVGKNTFPLTAKQDVKVCFKIIVNCIFYVCILSICKS